MRIELDGPNAETPLQLSAEDGVIVLRVGKSPYYLQVVPVHNAGYNAKVILTLVRDTQVQDPEDKLPHFRPAGTYDLETGRPLA